MERQKRRSDRRRRRENGERICVYIYVYVYIYVERENVKDFAFGCFWGIVYFFVLVVCCCLFLCFRCVGVLCIFAFGFVKENAGADLKFVEYVLCSLCKKKTCICLFINSCDKRHFLLR